MTAIEPAARSSQTAPALQRERQRDRLLGRISDLLPFHLGCDAMLQQVAEIAVGLLGEAAIVDGVGSCGRVRRVGIAPARAGVAAEQTEWDLEDAPALVRQAVIERQPVCVTDLREAGFDGVAPAFEQAQWLRGLGARSAASLPLVARDRVVAVLTLFKGKPDPRFDAWERGLALELVDRAAIAIDNACEFRRLQDEAQAREGALSVLSHDLRDPIHTISLATSLLLEAPGSTEETRKHLRTISRIAGDMNRFIQYLFDGQRLTAGPVALQTRPVEVGPMIRELLDNQQYGAASEHVTLESRVQQDLPPVQADRDRLLQVLTNLVQNARKFTVAGTICIEAEPQGDEVRFTVRDTGCGIPAENLPHVFERYWQAPGAGRRKGAGLGLSIVKAIVEAHGGRIHAESEPGVGTAMVFTVPAA